MHRFTVIMAAAAVAAPSGSTAQDIVLQDVANTLKVSRVFSETCSLNRKYALEFFDHAGQPKVLMRYGDKESPVSAKNLLNMVEGFDLYSVRMGCGPSNGLFFVALRKEDGRSLTQTLSIGDEGDIKVEPIRVVKRAPHS